MTPTEIIACKLFGWEACPAPTHSIQKWKKSLRWYSHPIVSDRIAMVAANPKTGTEVARMGRPHSWPDFWRERLQWYWIRKMEDALAERQMLKRYMMTLDGEFTVNASDPMPGTCITWQSFAMLRATAAQRVEAAVKVLEGQQ